MISTIVIVIIIDVKENTVDLILMMYILLRVINIIRSSLYTIVILKIGRAHV